MTKEEYQAIYDAKYAHLREKLPKVQDLCYRYGYNDMAKDESAMEVLLTTSYKIDERENNHRILFELESLLDFFFTCGSNFKLQGDVTDPLGGDVKGSVKKAFFSSPRIRKILIDTINTAFVNTLDSDPLNWNVDYLKKGKLPVMDFLNERKDNIDTFYAFDIHLYDNTPDHSTDTHPYFRDRFPRSWIRFDLQNSGIQYFYTRNAQLGFKCYFLDSILRKKGYFGHSPVKEYAFLYDLLVITSDVQALDIDFTGLIGKEKYTNVKNWIKAMETMQEKMKKKDRLDQFQDSEGIVTP